MSASRITESCVVPAPIHKVWQALRSVTFEFWSAVQSVKVEGSVDQSKLTSRFHFSVIYSSAVGSIRTVTFKDGTVQKYRIIELSGLFLPFAFGSLFDSLLLNTFVPY